ncbi:hypothetical protein SSX86_014312 [Deinandra increscens subsp. villosa]|uniref:Uncharacterized protein n=1 Tax=Deinandra increscens subsp. villosa TaxID=3103831 RepID=A0AAP0GXI5_9ASTR
MLEMFYDDNHLFGDLSNIPYAMIKSASILLTRWIEGTRTTLEKLRDERQAKIDVLKERAIYYITQQLIQVKVTMTLSTSVAASGGLVPMASHQICLELWLALSLLTDALALVGQKNADFGEKGQKGATVKHVNSYVSTQVNSIPTTVSGNASPRKPYVLLQGRESISAKVVANFITEACTDRVLAYDLHSGQSMGYFDIPVDHVYCQPVILDYHASKSICSSDLVVVSPDASIFATLINASINVGKFSCGTIDGPHFT